MRGDGALRTSPCLPLGCRCGAVVCPLVSFTCSSQGIGPFCSAQPPSWVELGTTVAVSIVFSGSFREMLRSWGKGPVTTGLRFGQQHNEQGAGWALPGHSGHLCAMRGAVTAVRTGGCTFPNLSCDSKPRGAEVCLLCLSCTVGLWQIFPQGSVS